MYMSGCKEGCISVEKQEREIFKKVAEEVCTAAGLLAQVESPLQKQVSFVKKFKY